MLYFLRQLHYVLWQFGFLPGELFLGQHKHDLVPVLGLLPEKAEQDQLYDIGIDSTAPGR